jgi:hypothetical protein
MVYYHARGAKGEKADLKERKKKISGCIFIASPLPRNLPIVSSDDDFHCHG